MDLDDLKEKSRQIAAPRDDTPGGAHGTDTLVQAIRTVDERVSRQARKAKPFFFVASLVYLLGGGLSILGFSPGASSRALHLGALGGILMLLAVLLAMKARSLRELDYSRPVKAFLAEAETRYRFIRPVDITYSIPLLLVLAITGGRLFLDALIPRYIEASQRGPVLAAYAVFFLAVCGMGYYFTYRNWKREKGPVLADIRRMRQEME